MIQTQYTPSHYTGNGTLDTYGFSFRILAKSDLLVLTRDADDVVVTLQLDSDYTIDDAYVDVDGGGSVVLTDPLADGTELFFIRDTARTQLVNIEEGSPFPTATVIKVFDRLTMMLQELKYLTRKALKFANASTFVDVDVPDPDNGALLSWLNDLLINTNIGDQGEEIDVTAGLGEVDITFATPLADANYQVIAITTNWNTTTNWSDKLTTGFTITFGTVAPTGAKLSYRILRS